MHFLQEADPVTRRFCVAALILALLQTGSAANPPAASSTNMDGYSPSHATPEREWETKFRSLPDPKNRRDTMQRLSAHPHHVGSPYAKASVEWMLANFNDCSFFAQIETFYVWFY